MCRYDLRSGKLILLFEFLLAFTFSGLSADLFVVLLKGSKILTSFAEFALLHTFSDVPVDESTLGVHKIELMIQAAENFSDGAAVANHANSALHLGEVTTGHHSGWLVVNTALEASRAPVNELDGTLGLDGSNGGVHVLGHNISTEHKAASHVLSVTGVALGHHAGGLESSVGDLGHAQLLVVCLLSRDNGGVAAKHEMDTRVGHQVGLELSHINVQSAIETQRSSQRRDDLGDQTVQVGVSRALDIKAATADIVTGFVVKHDSDISVLQQRVGAQDRVVRLNNSGGHLRAGVHGETELGLLAVVNRQALQQEAAKTRAGTTANGVEHEEALETSALIGELANAVEYKVDDFLANGVVTTSVVVSGVFLAGHQLLGVVQLAVSASADLIHNSGLEINEHSAGHVLAGTSLAKEGVESIIAATDGLVTGHLAIRLDSVLKAVEFPAGVSDLNTGLTDV